jgi:hypothetical protein
LGYKEQLRHQWANGVGCAKNNEKIYLDACRKHPKDVLIVELGKYVVWDKLCAFLGKSILKKVFYLKIKTLKDFLSLKNCTIHLEE